MKLKIHGISDNVTLLGIGKWKAMVILSNCHIIRSHISRYEKDTLFRFTKLRTNWLAHLVEGGGDDSSTNASPLLSGIGEDNTNSPGSLAGSSTAVVAVNSAAEAKTVAGLAGGEGGRGGGGVGGTEISGNPAAIISEQVERRKILPAIRKQFITFIVHILSYSTIPRLIEGPRLER